METWVVRKLIVVVICVVLCAGQRLEDPLCVLKNCPNSTTCRVVKECSSPGSCTLTPQCLSPPPMNSHTGVCQIGDPILELRDGVLGDTYCGPTLLCPDSTYCNTELQDTYSTCCRSDPTKPVKAGTCPVSNNPDTFFCVDTCNNDGDCRGNTKCCTDGCRKSCLPPQVVDPCQSKVCPQGSYCLSPQMPKCTGPGRCWNVGDCVSCGGLCRMYCPFGNERDSRGCPICQCKPPTPRPPQPDNNVGNRFNPWQRYTRPAKPTNNMLWYYLWNSFLF